LVLNDPFAILIGALSGSTIFNRSKLKRNLRIQDKSMKIMSCDNTIPLLIPEQKILLIKLDCERVS
jgi:hypothetical protein